LEARALKMAETLPNKTRHREGVKWGGPPRGGTLRAERPGNSGKGRIRWIGPGKKEDPTTETYLSKGTFCSIDGKQSKKRREETQYRVEGNTIKT